MSIEADPTLPTTREELERKSLELLTHTAHQREVGAIERRGAFLTAHAVWTLTAGLVDQEVSDLAARLAEENQTSGWKRYFIGNEPTKSPLILAVVPGRAYALIKVDPTTGQRTTLKHRQHEPGDLERQVAAVCASLVAGGYHEL